MQIVIDIPKEQYINIKNGAWQRVNPNDMYEMIENGTSLPKGHGDLIDADELKKEIYTMTEWNGDICEIIYKESLDYAPTIIEADKEE